MSEPVEMWTCPHCGSMFDVKRFNLTRCLDCGFPVDDEDAVPDEWGDVV